MTPSDATPPAPTDADGDADWDLSVMPLEDATARADGDGFLPVAVDRLSLTDVENSHVIRGDEPVDSYQSHLLEDEEPDAEYVAHVEDAASLLPAGAPGEAVAAPSHTTETAQADAEDNVPAATVATRAVQVIQLAQRDALMAALVGAAELRRPVVSAASEEPAPRDAIDEVTNAHGALAVPHRAAVEDPGCLEQRSVNGPIEQPEWIKRPAPTIPAVEPASAADDRPPQHGSASAVTAKDVGADGESAGDDSEDGPIAEGFTDPDADERIGHDVDEDWTTDVGPEGSVAMDADELEESLATAPAVSGSGWTLPLLCLGIAIIAFCLIIPQADANRRLAYERLALRADLESIQTQVATNDEFLRKLASDPTLAERLAQRQLNWQRVGTKALAIGLRDTGTSPFDLVKVPPPAPMPPYEPVGGKAATYCRDGRSRLYVMGAGLFVLAAGLILGIGEPRRR